MKVEFSQIKGINKRKFVLYTDRIVVETTTIRKIDKYEVKLDQLGLNIHCQSDNTLPSKIVFVCCLILLLGSIIGIIFSTGQDKVPWIVNSILWSLIACFTYFKKPQNDICLVGGRINLVFFQNIPNETEVFEFIEKVKAQIKFYLKEKYTVFDNTTDERDFYGRLNWLLDREVISQSEFLEIKKKFELQKLF